MEEKMKQIKQQIERKLDAFELNEAKELIDLYEQKAPMDLDLIAFKSIYYLYANDLDQALHYALLGTRRYPLTGDLYYNLASIYEQRNDILNAYENYEKASFLFSYTHDPKEAELQLSKKLAQLWQMIQELIGKYQEEGNLLALEKIQNSAEQAQTHYGFHEIAYRSGKQVIGNYYWVSPSEKRYVGAYRKQFDALMRLDCRDLIHHKGEFLTVTEGADYQVKGNAEEYLLPIAVENNQTIHFFEKEGMETFLVPQDSLWHFNYYRVPNNVSVHSSKKAFYGNPIPLGVDPSKKKVVLNIFIDGLSQEILNGEDFQKVMPNTYEFFRKGTICTQAYATAEWTYPSIANYVTGLDTPHHMLIHNMIDGAMPEDVPTLPEYFKEAGYFTAKQCGNWRIIPSYGHARGYDQFIYQHQHIGYRAEMIVGDVVDHLEAFQDTNQFLWMSIGDLHDIADGFDLPLAIQNNISLKERSLAKAGETSAKQEYSEDKIKAFIKSASHVDVLLSLLYNYLENKYQDNEIIVSLFADHGQSFLVPPEEHFMCKERAKVAFMIRGTGSAQITDEIISTSDYVNIMCKLAGIPMKNVETSGQLPVCFGGEKEREYALTESIHPKDPYYATFFTKHHTIYFENGAPTAEDGRFELKNYTISIKDLDGNPVEDQSMQDKYLRIVFEHIAPLIIY